MIGEPHLEAHYPAGTSGDPPCLEMDGKDIAEDRPHRKSILPPRRRRNYWASATVREAIICPPIRRLGYLTEARLIEQAQRGDVSARNAVWETHLRLAMSVVNRFRIPEWLVPDAFQEAALGLESALSRFEVRRFHSFSTYAWYWMANRIRRLLIGQRFAMRLPDYLHQTFVNFCKERDACLNSYQWFDWYIFWSEQDPEQFRAFIHVYLMTYSSTPLHFINVVDEMDGHERRLSETELALRIRKAVASLPGRHARILTLRFGLYDGRELTLKQIGYRLGLTSERIRQIQKDALHRLANHLVE